LLQITCAGDIIREKLLKLQETLRKRKVFRKQNCVHDVDFGREETL
jgi:hypothetical protein